MAKSTNPTGNTISSFQRSIQRFLRDSKSQFNILSDKEYKISRQVLAAKRKHLVNKDDETFVVEQPFAYVFKL